MRTEEPPSQLTHRGRKVHLYFSSSFSAVGKVPGDSAVSPLDPQACSIFRSERPLQRKAAAPKHSRLTLVRFTLFASRKCGPGEDDVFLALCLVFLSLVDWNRRVASPSPSLRLPSDSMPFVYSRGAEVTRRYERPSHLGAVVFVFHWATVPHSQSYAVA